MRLYQIHGLNIIDQGEVDPQQIQFDVRRQYVILLNTQIINRNQKNNLNTSKLNLHKTELKLLVFFPQLSQAAIDKFNMYQIQLFLFLGYWTSFVFIKSLKVYRSFYITRQSLMFKPNPYEYNFFSVRSLNFDHLPKAQQQEKTLDRCYSSEINHAIQSFLRIECFKITDLVEFSRNISKMIHFQELGLDLFQICLIEFGITKNPNKQDLLQRLRQSIYDNLQDIKKEICQRSDGCLKILPLFYYAVIKKMFTLTKMVLSAEFKTRISHIIFFQLSGEMVTVKYLENLTKQYFNENYQRFIKEYSQNITPLKTKNRSLLRSEIQENREEGKFRKVGKENSSGNTIFQTNRLIMSKIGIRRQVQPKSPKGIFKI